MWTSPNMEFATVFVGAIAVLVFGLSFWSAGGGARHLVVRRLSAGDRLLDRAGAGRHARRPAAVAHPGRRPAGADRPHPPQLGRPDRDDRGAVVSIALFC